VLDAAQSAAQQAAHPVVVNVHPAAGPPAMTRDALFRRSVAFFRWLLAEREARSPDVWVVAELQGPPLAGEDVIRVGDTYDELLCLAAATGVALCWDLGHAVLSHRHRDAPLDPPDAFLRRVAHVHCHDLREQDHRPLLYDGVPWRRFLRNLRDTGFDGTVVLEVPPGRFLDLEAPGFDALARSLSSLRETIGLDGGR
jgi:sugar phosphate isomerase/epimerase